MTSRGSFSSNWFVLFILLLFSVAAPLTQFKVPPVMPILMQAFSLPAGKAGLLMSVFAFTGLLLALPAGYIFHSLGFRVTGLIAILSMVVGSALGALSTGIGILLATRFIEGIGWSLTSILGPALIVVLFAEEKRGKAMGIWCCSVPLGQLLAFTFAPLLVARWGWQGLWWFGCSYAVVVGFLYVIFVKTTPGAERSESEATESQETSARDLARVLRNRDLWLMSLLFCCFNFILIAFMTWLPAYCYQVRGLSLHQADLLMSVMVLGLIISGPLGGWVSDKLKSRRVICVVPMLLLTILPPLPSITGTAGQLAVIVIVGLIGAFIPTGVFSGVPEVAPDRRLHGMAMAIILIGQNVGMILGPLTFGWFVDSAGGWQAAFWSLLPVGAAGVLAGWKVRFK
jgi:predicted MFS family arabinose efflux permease